MLENISPVASGPSQGTRSARGLRSCPVRRVSGPSGFTLIELLAVIAIIAILAAILFPVFASARRRASETSCLSNLKQLSSGVRMYVDDWGGRYPWNAGPRFSPSLVADIGLPRDDPSDRSNRLDAAPVRGLLRSYVRSGGVWYCPALPQNSARLIENGPPAPGEEDLKGQGSASDYQVNPYLFVNSIPHAKLSGVQVARPHSGPVSDSDIIVPEKLRVFQDFWNQSRGVHSGGVNAARADGSAAWQKAQIGITNFVWWAW